MRLVRNMPGWVADLLPSCAEHSARDSGYDGGLFAGFRQQRRKVL